MQIELTNKEFRHLLDLVYIGNWVLNSTRGEDRFADYDDLESKLFGLCRNCGMKVLVEDWNNLQPADGKDSVSDLQKWRVCVDFSDDVDDQLTALFAVMTEKQFQKVEIANDFGVTPNAYVTLLELRPQYDANGNGSYTQAEIKKAIDNLPGRYTTAQKAVLWQLVTGASSAKNNPYDQKTGQMVLAAKSGSAGSSSGSSSDFSAEIMKQLIGE